MIPLIRNILKKAKADSDEIHNYCIVSLYTDGKSHISKHRDFSDDIEDNTHISCCSFYPEGTKTFRTIRITKGKRIYDIRDYNGNSYHISKEANDNGLKH